MRAAFVLTAAVAASVVATAAHAQTPSEVAAAQGWFQEGLAFEGSGQWKDALERFRRVAAVKHTPQVDFHIGLSEARVGELVLALVDLERALEASRAQHVANVESAASAELETLRPRVPRLQILVPSGAAVQKVTIDDRPVASVALGDPIAVDPGAHTVTVSFATGDFTQRVALEERALVKVNVEVPVDRTPPPPVTPPPAKEGPAPPPPSPSSGTSTLGWVLVGTGGAALVGSVVFWLMRGHELSTLDGACGADRQHCPDSVRPNYDAAQTDTAVSGVLFGAGLLAAGVGAVLLVTRRSSPPPSSAIMAPLVLRGGGGAALSGRF